MIDIGKIRRSVGMIGESEIIRDMLLLIGQVADTDISVLIHGESGTGKEMVTKAIHKNSRRKFEPLVVVNCSAIPAGIIESELFGHKKGSFTGAGDDRKGYFEAAHKGTIILDEIGETPIETQAKLLRVIEQGEFMRVGGSKTEKIDVRVIAATNRDLTEEVRQGRFRKDLYFRLKTITINVPALKDHASDIHLFVERFGLEFCAKNDIAFKGFSVDAIKVLKSYHWPGNIRELKNLVESLIVIHKGIRLQEDHVNKALGLNVQDLNMNLPILLDGESDKMERELILKQLLFVRQDVNEIKQILYAEKDNPTESMYPSNQALFLPQTNKDPENIHEDYQEIDDDKFQAIHADAVGEITITDLEHEMIERTLEKFNNNRRKTAKSLDISERTLYRKISEYGIKKI